MEVDNTKDLFFLRKRKDGIQISKSWEEQFKSKEAVKWVLYMYSNYTTSFFFSSYEKLIFDCLLVGIFFFTSPQSSLLF